MTPISPMNFAIGLITSLFCVMSGLLGAFMIKRYLKFKEKQLLYVGLTWTFLSTAWWGDALTFDSMLLFGNDVWLPDPIYFLLKVVLILPIFLLWPQVYGELVLNEKKTLRNAFIWSAITSTIVLEIIFLIYFSTDYKSIGIRIGPYSAIWSWIVIANLSLIAIFFVIPGLIFSRTAVQSENPIIKKKGEMLFFAFLSLLIAGILEVLFGTIEIINLITRIMYVYITFHFYLGFTLPKFVKKIFKIEQQ
ncbi:MAG: hypothetical protein JW891_00475 [Candidatus Lokiarchaeota archaeon]|nr:hypothetical protein [Candidatus Lokiarchaeota archaeon]